MQMQEETALGARAPLTEALPAHAVRFRLAFTEDRRSKELRWVLFASSQRGAVGKLVFTLEKDCAAHVKSVSVSAGFRGLGLARVLYLACVATLRERGVRELHLEAEEDTRRHGKLVGLYRSWGFMEKRDASVLFLYNDAECFRKVPMLQAFYTGGDGADGFFFPVRPQEGTWFCMVTLQTTDGACLVASEDGALEVRTAQEKSESMWQTLLGPHGEVFLRSVHGKFLCVQLDGTILADRRLNSTWETFQVLPQHASSTSACAGGVALQSFHGSYLGIDPLEKKVGVSAEPVLWDGGETMALVCNKETARPLFAKIMRKYQTCAFVAHQTARFSELQHAQLSVLDACRAVVELTGETEREHSWVLKYMLASADAVRLDGHPDWLQLAIFLRALGLLFLRWPDGESAALRSISAQEWLTKNVTWIVGTIIPSSIDFPELNELNVDHCRALSSTGASGVNAEHGMEHAVLPWTPDEYLYRVLAHNKTTLPAEALSAVRFWSFKTWFQQNNYEAMCSPQDLETKDWLSSLGRVAAVSESTLQSMDVEAALPYYLHLADKYLPETLRW